MMVFQNNITSFMGRYSEKVGNIMVIFIGIIFQQLFPIRHLLAQI